MTKACCPTVQNTPRIPVQPLVWEAVELNRDKIDNKQDIDVDGWCPFGRYQVHITDQGRSWLRIEDREWELAFQNVTRFQSDGRRKNSRMMPTAWGRQQQPRQLPVCRGFRASVVGRDGKRGTYIFQTGTDLGTRTECGIGYDIWRLSNKHRRLLKRATLIMEVCPYASKQKVIEKAESGWWPTDRQRPRGMARPRFRRIVAALRDGKHMNGKRVYHGREQFQAKLPPPLPPLVPPPASDRPETAAEEFFRIVYGEKLKL